MALPINPFGIRIPPDLKDWLSRQALNNRRSLNAELVKRLEESKNLDLRKISTAQ